MAKNRKVSEYDYYARLNFVNDVREITGYTKKDVNEVVNAMYKIIEQNIIDSVDMDLGAFYITNFLNKGGFEKKNILTGQMVIMPPRRMIKMKLKNGIRQTVKRSDVDNIQSVKISEKGDNIDK